MEHRQTTLNLINWPNTEQIINTATLNVIKKAITANSSHDINAMFATREPKHLRHGKAQIISHKGPIKRPSNQFTTNGTELFNKLPYQIRQSTLSCTKFKQEVKTYSRTVNLLRMH